MPSTPAPKHERTNWASEDEFLFGLIRKLDCPVFLVLTKIDLVPKDHLLPLIDTLTKQFNFAQIIPVSARKRDGLDMLGLRHQDHELVAAVAEAQSCLRLSSCSRWPCAPATRCPPGGRARR
jgi:GTPase Era involved in 16S rRNA processing